MPIVESSILIRAPRAGLLTLSQDYYLRREWDPFVREMRFVEGATGPAVGARVWVRAWNGLSMTVEYVVLRPPEAVAIKMVEGPVFLEKFAGAWRFEERADGLAEVFFRYHFSTGWPWLRPVLDPAFSLVFRRDIRARLAALKRAAEETDILSRVAAADYAPAAAAPARSTENPSSSHHGGLDASAS